MPRIPVLVLAATVYNIVMMMQFNQELHVLMLMSQATPQQVGEEESRLQDWQMTGFGLQKRREETNNLFLVIQC